MMRINEISRIVFLEAALRAAPNRAKELIIIALYDNSTPEYTVAVLELYAKYI